MGLLRLFSPARYSSLPGWPMPKALRTLGIDAEYPHRDHVAAYLAAYAGRVPVTGTRADRESRLWLVGYGQWTGFASATLIGVGRTAQRTVREIEKGLS